MKKHYRQQQRHQQTTTATMKSLDAAADTHIFSTADVYEHAASIGKGIEFIVNEYGKEAIEDIMPKIVYVLEQLEHLAETHHTDKGRIEDLMMERDKLIIHSKRDEAIQRELEEKLGYMEGLVTKDKKDLERKLKLLQRDNNTMIEEIEKKDNEIVKFRTHGALPGDVEVMMGLKTTIDGQRDQIRHLNHETQSQRKELEALQEHTSRLNNINERLRANMLLAQSKLKKYGSTSTLDEVADIFDESDGFDNQCHESICSSPDDELRNSSALSLHDELSDCFISEQTNSHDDMSTATNLTRDEESNNDDDNNNGGHKSLQQQNGDDTTTTTTTTAATADNRVKKDPNRPRYTLHEMQSLLEERNLYKIKMIALEEELQLYKSGRRHASTSSGSSVEMAEKQQKQTGVRSFMQKFLGK